MAKIQSNYSTAFIGAAFVLVSAVAFSSKAVMVKLAYGYHVDAETLLALRMAFAAPFYLASAVWLYAVGKVDHLDRRDIGAILLLGTVGGYLPMWFDFAGLQYVSAGVERVILFLYPTMVVIISAVMFGYRIGRLEVAALAASYVGVALAAGDNVFAGQATGHTMLGAVLIFFSAMSYAAYLVASGRMIRKFGAMAFTACIMLVISLTAAGHYFATPHHVDLTRLPQPVYVIALLMAVVATVLPSFLLSAGIQRVGSNRAAMLGMVGPVSTILLAWVFLGEGVTGMELVGTGLVMAGVLAITVRPGAGS